MNKHIVVIGGGISGLSVLHHLKKKYSTQPETSILLLEKNLQPGGTICTRPSPHGLFECGPNGFLDHKESTLNLAKELGLEDELIWANEQSKLRYICLNNTLHALPTSPSSLWRFQPLSFFDKLRIALEMFIPQGNRPDETVSEFGCRRLGRRFVEYFLDPMALGIYGGDAKKLNLREAFPRIYEIEQTYGSLLKGMLRLIKEKRLNNKRSPVGQPTGRLVSFRKGMAQLIATLHEKYSSSIRLAEEVRELKREEGRFVVDSTQARYFAGEIFLCTPAYAAASILKTMTPSLAELLSEIPYAPIAVVGLRYRRSAFTPPPKGFGYLIPSGEQKEVLGVLFCSNIFADPSTDDYILFRVMIGGTPHPEAVQKSAEELVQLAHQEIQATLKVRETPAEQFLHIWPKAIPQYDSKYARLKPQILEELQKIPHLHLVANYLNGVSLNDCTANAQSAIK